MTEMKNDAIKAAFIMSELPLESKLVKTAHDYVDGEFFAYVRLPGERKERCYVIRFDHHDTPRVIERRVTERR